MVSNKWNRHTIVAALHSKEMTLSGLVSLYNLSKSSVTHIWKRPNEAAERAIADFLDEPVESLFPDRYPKSKKRILGRRYESRI